MLSGNRRELPLAPPSPGCHRRARTEAGSGPQSVQPSQEVADEAQSPRRLNLLRLDRKWSLYRNRMSYLMFAALDFDLC